MFSRRWLDGVLVVVVAAAATLPWLDKAYHIDDVLYLMVAEQIRHDPLRPYGDKDRTYILWDSEDGNPGSLFHTDYNPPLWKYVLAAAIEILGDQEWKLHLVSALAVFLAAWPIYLLARRWTSRPVWCVAMILWSPFFLPGQNLMIEPFLLCLASWSTYWLARSWENGNAMASLAAGVLAGAAVITKYTAGVLLGVYGLGGLIFGKPRSLLALASAGGVMGLWMAHNAMIYGQQHLGDHGVTFHASEWPVRALTVLRIIGAVSIFWPMLLHRLWMQGAAGRWALALVMAGSVLCGCLDLQQAHATFRGWGIQTRLGLRWHFVVFTSLGAATVLSLAVGSILDMARDPRKWASERTERFLEVWIGAMLMFNVTSVPFNAVRHLLLAFVPMTWLAARRYPADRRMAPGLCLIASTALGVSLALADYEFAALHRTLASTTLRRDVESKASAGNHLWYTGNWGWVYYASRQGALPYFEHPEVWGLPPIRRGDRIYHPKATNWRGFRPFGNRLLEAEPIEFESNFPVRTITFPAHYYGITSSALPWVVPIFSEPDQAGTPRFQSVPLERVSIYDVLEAR